jgi:hypothetical protein
VTAATLVAALAWSLADPQSATTTTTEIPPEGPPSPPIWTVPVVHTAGVLLGMRLSLSVIWTDAYNPFPLSRSGRQFGYAYTNLPEFRSDRMLFESDGDPWVINVVGHGLFGSEVHSRVRQCGGSLIQAIAFTTASSIVWEYAIESFTKRPSAIDLMLTPVLGGLLGEGRFQLQRWLRQQPRGFWRRFGEIVVDPLGEGERAWLKTRC